jgi:hypothetical protein
MVGWPPRGSWIVRGGSGATLAKAWGRVASWGTGSAPRPVGVAWVASSWLDVDDGFVKKTTIVLDAPRGRRAGFLYGVRSGVLRKDSRPMMSLICTLNQ